MPLSPSTLRVYVSTLKRVYGIDPLQPPKLEGNEVTALPPGNYTEETTNSTRSIIRGALRWWYSTAGIPEVTAVGETLANRIPFRHEVKKRKRYPSSEEVAAFWKVIAELPSPKQEMLAIPLLLGLRANEFLSLSREAVSQALSTGILTVQRKGAKEGELPVVKAKGFFKKLFGSPKHSTVATDGAETWTALWQVYANSQKGAYHVLYRLVASAAKKSGSQTEWTPHTLRHAFASEMIRAGAPLAVVQRALGHSSYMTTVRTYVHIDTKDLEKWMDRADAVIEEAAKPKPKVKKQKETVTAPEQAAPLPEPVPVIEVEPVEPEPVPVVEIMPPPAPEKQSKFVPTPLPRRPLPEPLWPGGPRPVVQPRGPVVPVKPKGKP
jgi:site-specific recombinase XerD